MPPPPSAAGTRNRSTMEIRARYVLIGSFTLAVLLGAFTFIYWLQNTVGLGQVTYRVRFTEPVSGLGTGGAVLFNGARVGTISGLELDQQDPRRLTATIAVNAATPIRADTTVDITHQGLTGAPTIALKGGSANAPQMISQNGRPPELVAGPGVGRNITESVQQTLNKIDGILDENAKPLHTAIVGISDFADMLGKNSKRVEGLIGGLEKLTGGGSDQQAPKVYDLAAANDFATLDKTIGVQMVVPDPTAILLFDTQKILIRTEDGTYSNVKGGQWADNLPKLMQARVVQSFENAHQLKEVSKPFEMTEGAYRLELGIRNFQVTQGPTPAAVVEFSARVLDDKSQVTGARIFNISAPAKTVDASDAVTALNTAFSKAAHELVVWTVETLSAEGGSSPDKEPAPAEKEPANPR
jgi:phospholipid/cholesterol/gamma-HCH transport system substrate-binding protein